MKWFKNLKISVKLISTFLIIALIAGGVGTYGIVSLSDANRNSNVLFEDYGNSQGYLGYIFEAFLMIALVAIAVILAIILGLFMTGMIAKPIKRLSEFANRIAAGDMTVMKTSIKQKDEVGEIFDAVRAIFDAINKLAEDANMLTESAIKGELSVRADALQHKGEYRKIIEGVNGTLDAIIDPIKGAMEVIHEVSLGNLAVSVKGDYHGDFASFKEALNVTVWRLKAIIGEISVTLGEISNGNLDVEITKEYYGNFMAIKDSINGIAAALNATMIEINTAADQVASGSCQVSEGMQETSQGATKQASSIQDITASISEIAKQTMQNALTANQANQLTAETKIIASKGTKQMQIMQGAIEGINESTVNIRKIIKVIDDIAFQTGWISETNGG